MRQYEVLEETSASNGSILIEGEIWKVTSKEGSYSKDSLVEVKEVHGMVLEVGNPLNKES